jgi:hypothetical protein
MPEQKKRAECPGPTTDADRQHDPEQCPAWQFAAHRMPPDFTGNVKQALQKSSVLSIWNDTFHEDGHEHGR